MFAKRLASVVLLCLGILPLTSVSEEKNSGFLADYNLLQPHPEVKGTLLWRKEGVTLKGYDKVLIEPIEIWVSPDSKYKGVDPEELRVLTTTFRQVLVNRLEPEYPVVDRGGAGVLGLRLAITDVNMQNKKRNVLGYLPIGFVVTTAANAMGMRMVLDGAAIEAELYDAKTEQRLLGMLDTRLGDEMAEADKKPDEKEQINWEKVQNSLDFYAQRLRATLDREHGR